ncbi:hypothetical protein GH810_05620 [Acetobacterium paludosum]|uniref:Uncharacterized protein n=1 Tax=Acetobacterium paludosum TaxID=52693 RepID=A0A923HWA9_9FIRM|nr:hypothetical protein [Acetobacterium paludosum]MBC3887784.1 hypothetical protein [Acetobacterium paludosum]
MTFNFDQYFPTVSTMVTTCIAFLIPEPLQPSPDCVALTIRSGGSLVRNHHNRNSPVTTVGTVGNLGTKKMGLVGEFKFFIEFSR